VSPGNAGVSPAPLFKVLGKDAQATGGQDALAPSDFLNTLAPLEKAIHDIMP